MLWLIAVAGELIFETLIALRYRRLAQGDERLALVRTAGMYIFGVFPIAVGYAVSTGIDVGRVTRDAWALIVVASLLFSIANIWIYKAYAHIEASLYTLVSISKSVMVVVLASIMLHDPMSVWQWIGSVLVIGASLIFALASYKRSRRRIITIFAGVAFVASVVSGIATIAERYILGVVPVGTYVLLGWGFQALILAIVVFAGGSLRALHETSRDKHVVGIGILRGLAGICIVYALAATQNAALIGSLMASKVIVIAIASYIFLKERSMPRLRITLACIATIGLLMIVIQ